MRYKLADSIGYCYGVQRAAQKVDSLVCEIGEFYTLGELIHNKQVSDRYLSLGVKIAEDINDIENGGTVVIRSHGVPETVYLQAKDKGLNVHDCTCPYVKKIHSIVRKKSLEGKHIFIVGDSNHPEVLGIKGWVIGECTIINNKITFPDNAFVVAQTTLNVAQWNEIVSDLPKEMYENTICYATQERQLAVRKLAKEVDLMIIIGGKHSSNTKKLAKIASEIVETLHIETADELDLSGYDKDILIGIGAGASTPNVIIEDAIKTIQNEGGKE